MPILNKIDAASVVVVDPAAEVFDLPPTRGGVETTNVVEVLTQNPVTDSPYTLLVGAVVKFIVIGFAEFR